MKVERREEGERREIQVSHQGVVREDQREAGAGKKDECFDRDTVQVGSG
jgi:hypothetical protein